MIKLPKEIRSYKNFHYVNDKLKESNKYAPEVNNKNYLLDIMIVKLTPKQQEFIEPIRHLLSKGHGFVCSTGKKAQTTYENGYLSVDIQIDMQGNVCSARDNTATGSINYDTIALYTKIYQDPKTHKTKFVFEDYYLQTFSFSIIFDVEKDTIESTFPDAVNPFKPTEEECGMFLLQHGIELNLYNYQEVKRTELQKSYEEQFASVFNLGSSVGNSFKSLARAWSYATTPTQLQGVFTK